MGRTHAQPFVWALLECFRVSFRFVLLVFANLCQISIKIVVFDFQHEAEYKEIIDAVKGSEKEKRLASQFIGKFFKFFPTLADAAIDASLDLCEDENIQIRRQAIRDLPQLCKDSKDHTSKIGDILAQLLVVEDATELQQVHMSLQTLIKYDAKGTLAGLVSLPSTFGIMAES